MDVHAREARALVGAPRPARRGWERGPVAPGAEPAERARRQQRRRRRRRKQPRPGRDPVREGEAVNLVRSLPMPIPDRSGKVMLSTLATDHHMHTDECFCDPPSRYVLLHCCDRIREMAARAS